METCVFHDDQHGTAVVTVAALINAMKLTKRNWKSTKIVIIGAGAAGICIGLLLHHLGVEDLILCDTEGAIWKGRPKNMNKYKDAVAEWSNVKGRKGTVAEVVKGADVIVGVSSAGMITKEMIKTMAEQPIIFALANPVPEIMPSDAIEAGAYIVATGRSD